MKRVINYTLAVLTLLLGVSVLFPLHGQNPIQVFFGTAPWSSNSGAKDAATGRVVLATDQPQLTNALKVDGSGVTQPVSGTVTANQGGTWTVQPGNTANTTAWKVDGSAVTQPVSGTVAATQSGAWSLSANQSINVAQINGITPLMGNGVTGTGSPRVTVASDNTPFESYPVATATTTDGVITTNCYITSAASTNSTNCKASAGNVYFIHITNTTTTNYFLRLYNASSAPTCSSSTGFVETIPALGASANGGINGRVNVVPQSYTTGIGFCLTGGGSSTDNTNAATGVYVTIGYK